VARNGVVKTYLRERTKRVRARQSSRARVAEATGERGLTVGGRRGRKGRKGGRQGGGQGGRTSGEAMQETPDLLLWGSLALGAFLLFKK